MKAVKSTDARYSKKLKDKKENDTKSRVSRKGNPSKLLVGRYGGSSEN